MLEFETQANELTENAVFRVNSFVAWLLPTSRHLGTNTLSVSALEILYQPTAMLS
jgi:hypothetical protein